MSDPASLFDCQSLDFLPFRLERCQHQGWRRVINSNVYREDGEFVHTRCFTTCIDEEPWKAIKKDFDAKIAAAT